MSEISMSEQEVLNYAIQSGILNLTLVQEQIEMQKKKEILEKHPYAISQGKDGKWRTYLPDEEKGRVQKKRNTKEDIENVVVEYWKEQAENPTIDEVFDEWNERRLSLNQIAHSTYDKNKSTYSRHYKKMGKRKIKSVSAREWEEFFEEQIAEHQLSAKSFSNLKSISKGFLKRAKKRSLITYPVEQMFQEMDNSDVNFKKTYKEDVEEVFMEDELSKMIYYLRTHDDILSLGVLLMFLTGIRVGELVALRYSDYCDNPCGFYIKKTETRFSVEGKTHWEIKDAPKTMAGYRFAIIPNEYSWIYEKLRQCNPFGEYIFMKDGKRLHTQNIRRKMYRTCDLLGIYRKSPHKARKTYGSILLDNKIDNNLIIGQMGHTDIMTTERHYHRNRKSISRKAEIISSIPEFQVI